MSRGWQEGRAFDKKNRTTLDCCWDVPFVILYGDKQTKSGKE